MYLYLADECFVYLPRSRRQTREEIEAGDRQGEGGRQGDGKGKRGEGEAAGCGGRA